MDQTAGRSHAWHSVLRWRAALLPPRWDVAAKTGPCRVHDHCRDDLWTQIYPLQVRSESNS